MERGVRATRPSRKTLRTADHDDVVARRKTAKVPRRPQILIDVWKNLILVLEKGPWINGGFRDAVFFNPKFWVSRRKADRLEIATLDPVERTDRAESVLHVGLASILVGTERFFGSCQESHKKNQHEINRRQDPSCHMEPVRATKPIEYGEKQREREGRDRLDRLLIKPR